MFITLKKDYLGHKAGATLDVHEEPVAKSLIEQGVAEAVQGDPYGPLMARAVEASVTTLGRQLDAVINKALEEFARAQGKSRKNAAAALFGEQGEGDPRHCFGDWCLCIATRNHKRLTEEYGSALVDHKGDKVSQKAPLGEASGSTGGYTVPPDFYQQLLALVAENAIFRPRAWVQPMASATLQFPYLDVTTVQSAGVPPFFGGVQMYWTEEAQTRTETEPQFKMMELKAHELSGYSVSSNVLLADAAFGLEKFLFTLFGQAIAWFEDYAFFQGNGVGKPVGVLNAGATITSGPNSGSRTTANQIQFADVAWMWSKLLPASWSKAFWAFSPTCIPQLLQLKDGASRAIFISIDQGITKTPVWSLLGRPALVTEKLPPLGTSGDIVLIDPSLYVIGDRMQVEVAASEHVNFLKNQMTWRVLERVDGQPWLEKPITLQDATTQVSPFVALHS
jgi:HK97 family phage major capsid protein